MHDSSEYISPRLPPPRAAAKKEKGPSLVCPFWSAAGKRLRKIHSKGIDNTFLKPSQHLHRYSLKLFLCFLAFRTHI